MSVTVTIGSVEFRCDTAAEALEVASLLTPLSAVHLGRRSGRKGGVARAASLTPSRRRAIAKAAALKRWGGTSSS